MMRFSPTSFAAFRQPRENRGDRRAARFPNVPLPRAGRAGLALAAKLLLLASAAAVGAQTGRYSVMIEGLRRSYAGAEVGEPLALSFARCMAQRAAGRHPATRYISPRPRSLSPGTATDIEPDPDFARGARFGGA
jgi:hypothetical protein